MWLFVWREGDEGKGRKCTEFPPALVFLSLFTERVCTAQARNLSLCSRIGTVWAPPFPSAKCAKLVLLVVSDSDLETRPCPRVRTVGLGHLRPVGVLGAEPSLCVPLQSSGWLRLGQEPSGPHGHFCYRRFLFFAFIVFDILKAEPHSRPAIAGTRLGNELCKMENR